MPAQPLIQVNAAVVRVTNVASAATTPAKTMTEQRTLTRAGLKTPRAAAIAGMLFSVLLIVVFALLRSAVPADPQEPGAWLNTD